MPTVTLNEVRVTANVTQEPVIREVGANKIRLAKIGIAINHSSKTSSGRTKNVVFLDIQAWAATADYVEKHIHKGDYILVEGHLGCEQWRDKLGALRSRIVIVSEKIQVVDPKSGNGEAGREPESPIDPAYGPPPAGNDQPPF